MLLGKSIMPRHGRNHRVWARFNDDEIAFIDKVGVQIGSPERTEALRYVVQFAKMTIEGKMISFHQWREQEKLLQSKSTSI